MLRASWLMTLLPTRLLPARLLPTGLLPTGLLPTGLLPVGLIATGRAPARPWCLPSIAGHRTAPSRRPRREHADLPILAENPA